MIIGLTIVSMGTSAPELVVNIQSALSGSTALALGNVVGSNIANILLVLAIGAVVTPLVVDKNTRSKDLPLLMLASLIIWVFVSDIFIDGALANILSRVESIALLGFFSIFMVYMYFTTINLEGSTDEKPVHKNDLLKAFFFVPVGILLLTFGGDFTVTSAKSIAVLFGISERIIGLTIVAVGTSLPELVTTVIAARKGEIDILIGNIVGSNIFNIFFILGVTGLISPLTIQGSMNFDFIFMCLALCIFFASLYIGKKHTIARKEGIFMILVYVIYIVLLLYK
jgi:cation:H+ antiporter